MYDMTWSFMSYMTLRGLLIKENKDKGKIMRTSSLHRFSLIKKTVFAVAACSAMAGISPAMAADAPVNSVSMHFVGAVTNATCDVRPFNSAGVDATTFNIGNIAPDNASTIAPVKLYLKPVNCTGGAIGVQNATVSWTSSGLSDHGLLNTGGTAKGVYVKLIPVNETGANPIDETAPGGVKPNQPIKEGANVVYYKASNTAKIDKPFAYQLSIAQDVNGTAGAGTIDADAIYSVSYY
ncbi:hypothetical protein FAP59_18080 [Morganella morganii]|nr:hypothetical protein [Morganella morganii]